MSAKDGVFLVECDPFKGSTMSVQVIKGKGTKIKILSGKFPSLPIKYINSICLFIDTHECMQHKYASSF